jgi:hypothetical protein
MVPQEGQRALLTFLWAVDVFPIAFGIVLQLDKKLVQSHKNVFQLGLLFVQTSSYGRPR